jgi:hypothetical protein
VNFGVSYASSSMLEAFFSQFFARLICLFCSQPKIQVGNHTINEIVFYNFNWSIVLAMDCPKEVVTSYSKTSGKTFLSLSHISCNLASG